MSDHPYLSVVIPVRDEVESLDFLHAELWATLRQLPGDSEVVFVDDGSRDGSGERLREIAARGRGVHVIALEGRQGQAAALDAGFRAARGDVVATLDADLQNDPADLPELLRRLEGADVVNGVRVVRRDGWLRRAASRSANAIRNWVTDETVTDVGCSLRVMRRAYLRRVHLHRGLHRFLPTLLRLEGARIVECPVSHRPRRYGRSKYGIGDRLVAGLADLCRVRRMQARAARAQAIE